MTDHFVDTHAHLDSEQFDATRDEVVDRALAAGVTKIISIGTTASSSAKCVELANQYESVHAAVGIQPNYCGEVRAGDWDQVVRLSQEPSVVALGETGLDKYWDDAPFDAQQDYFDRHLRLSQSAQLPFIVHMRECGEEVYQMLAEARKRGPLRGVMHSFTGDADLATRCIELGLHISFAGMVTFKKSHELRAVAEGVPADRLLIETDSPYLSPEPYRGKRPNEPARVVHTAECLAKARGATLSEIASLTTANAESLFFTRT